MSGTVTLLGVMPGGERISIDQNGRVSASREYRYSTSEGAVANRDAVLVQLMADVPWGATLHLDIETGDSGASGVYLYAQGYEVSYAEPSKIETEFTAVVHFRQLQGNNYNFPPWEREAIWSNSSRDMPYVTGNDVNGDPIVNGTNDPFDPTVEMVFGVTVYSCRFALKDVASVNAWKAVRRKINAAQVSVDGETIPAGQGIVRSFTSTTAYWCGQKYYECELVIESNDLDQGWNKRLILTGWYVKDGNNARVRATDAEYDSEGNATGGRIPSALPHYQDLTGNDITDAVFAGTDDPRTIDVPQFKEATWPTVPT